MYFKTIRFFSILIFITAISILGWLVHKGHFEHFKKTPSGLQFKVIKKGEGPDLQEGDQILIFIQYSTKEKVVIEGFSRLQRASYKLVDPSAGDPYSTLWSLLQKQGDHYYFKINAKKCLNNQFKAYATRYKLSKVSDLLVEIKIEKIMTEADIAAFDAEIETLQVRQLQADLDTIDHYLHEHNLAAQTTHSGLRYIIDQPTQGMYPSLGDTIIVNYTIQVLQGPVFDTTLASVAKDHKLTARKQYGPIEFKIGSVSVIPAWKEGMMLLKKREKARFWIPSLLAYGAQGRQEEAYSVPPNAILVLEVELVDIIIN